MRQLLFECSHLDVFATIFSPQEAVFRNFAVIFSIDHVKWCLRLLVLPFSAQICMSGDDNAAISPDSIGHEQVHGTIRSTR